MLGLFVAGAAEAATNIGVTSAVLPAARGTPPAEATRVLQVGADMVANERIVTDDGGKVHLLFLDGSALTIGPNSDLTLDEFVYDPVAKTGKIALSTTRGLFRLVGGKISKKTPITLKTPTATIGVRGGISMTAVTSALTQAVFLFGEALTATAQGQTQTALRPGSLIEVPAGGPPNPPIQVAGNYLAGNLANLEGAAGDQQGPVDVSDEDVAGSQVTNLNSFFPPPPDIFLAPPVDDPLCLSCATQEAALVESANITSDRTSGGSSVTSSGATITTSGLSGTYKHSTTRATGADTSFTEPFGNGIFSGGRFSESTTTFLDFPIVLDASDNFTFDGTSDSTGSPFGGITGSGFVSSNGDFIYIEATEDSFPGDHIIAFAGVPTADADVATPTNGVFRYTVKDDFLTGSIIPFISPGGGGDISGAIVSDAFLFIDDDASALQEPFLQASVGFEGTGTSQRSVFNLLVGQGLDDSGGMNFGFLQAGSTGTSLLDPTATINVFDGHVASADDIFGNDVFGLTNPDFILLEAAEVDSTDTTLSTGVDCTGPDCAVTTFFPSNLLSSTSAGTAGTTRTTVDFDGWVAGAGQVFSSGVAITSCNGGNLCMFRTATSEPTSVTYQTNATQNTAFASGNVDFPQLSAFNNTTFLFGDTGGATGNSAFIDDNLVGMIDPDVITGIQLIGTAATSALLGAVTDGVVEGAIDSILPSGVSSCTCAFMRWGYFSADVTAGTNNVLINLATFVVGDLPTAAEIVALTGSASYSGHAIGTVVKNNPADTTYIAAGAFAMSYNFGTQTGTATISQWDVAHFGGSGETFSFGVTSGGTGFENVYSGTASVAAPAGFTSSSIAGSFFRDGAANPAAGTGGHFDLFNSPTDYHAHGTFAAQK